MTLPFFPTVLIEPTLSKTTLTKAQKQFNTLVKKIEKLKAQLAEWSDEVPRHNERLRCEYQPLFNTYHTLSVELVKLLDRACNEKRLSKTERKKLRHLIPSIIAELNEEPSDELKALHDKYSDVGFDEQNEDVDDVVKAMMEDVFGFEVGPDVDINDPEQLRAFMEQQAQVENEKIQASHQADTQRAQRKQTARQIAQEQQQKSEAVLVQKSLQEIFRKLVAALHPDRAPDDAERERRTELMQRVNVAYEKKDLLQLLELQVHIEDVAATHINAQSDERLQHYNKILQEQSELLTQALEEAQLPFRYQLDLPPYAKLTARVVVAKMEQDLRNLKFSIAALQQDLNLLQDTAYLKAWLGEYKIQKEPEFDDLMDIFSTSPFRTN